MRIITINVPEHFLSFFEEIIAAGITPSRSECIRQLILRGIPGLLKDLEIVNSVNQRGVKFNQEMAFKYPEDDTLIRVPMEGFVKTYRKLRNADE